VVDETALTEALKKKEIRGAGLDFFEKEPLPADDPLTKMENVILTPHIVFLSEESLKECTYVCVGNIEKFIVGRSQKNKPGDS